MLNSPWRSERLVISVARKKIVLVIVEGPSDDAALGVILNRLFDKNTVHVEIMYGDITTDMSIDPVDIAKALGDVVKRYADSMHFKQLHFQQVIHLIDMDGAYIPDKCVTENPAAVKPLYSLTEIQTANKDIFLLRNKHKQSKIDRICGMQKVWGSIPYRAYYMSSNLDHVLYGKLNSSDDEKENDAYSFAKRYKDDVDGFLEFISDSDFSRMEGYKGSWEFIKKECHSLERYTNLGLCFSDIREERKASNTTQQHTTE